MVKKDEKPTFWNAWLIYGGGTFLGMCLISTIASLGGGEGLLAGLKLAWRVAALPCLLGGLAFAILMTAYRKLIESLSPGARTAVQVLLGGTMIAFMILRAR
jgi:hypothetical protein